MMLLMIRGRCAQLSSAQSFFIIVVVHREHADALTVRAAVAVSVWQDMKGKAAQKQRTYVDSVGAVTARYDMSRTRQTV